MKDAHSSNINVFNNQLPKIGAGSFVHSTSVLIGQVEIGINCSIWPNTVIRGDVNFIRIDEGTNIQDLCMLHVNHRSEMEPEGSPLMIGKYVTVGHSVILHGCKIEDECLIGMGSIVMDNAIIEKNVVLGAGSLVSSGKVLEGGFLYLGSPARKIRKLSADEISSIKVSAEQYILLKDQYLKG